MDDKDDNIRNFGEMNRQEADRGGLVAGSYMGGKQLLLSPFPG